MSTPIAAAILAALADGPMTTEALIEETGYERPAFVQTLAQLMHEKQAYPGRGGWRAGEPAIARVQTHEAVATSTEPAPKPEKKPKARSGKHAQAPVKRTLPRVKGTRRAVKTKPTKARAVTRFPRSAPHEVSVAIPLVRGAVFVFGITERGELTFCALKDYSRHGQLNAIDTARLAHCLQRWAPMLRPLPEAE